MDDIVAELSSFIERKEGMDTIKNLASSLMSGDGDVSSMLSSLMSNGAESVISPPKKEEPADFPGFAPDQLASIMGVMSALNKTFGIIISYSKQKDRLKFESAFKIILTL